MHISLTCIPFLLKNTKDLIGKAQTGTGKTAAFGIPIIENIVSQSKKVQALNSNFYLSLHFKTLVKNVTFGVDICITLLVFVGWNDCVNQKGQSDKPKITF